VRVGVIGDRYPDFAPQDAIETALHHSGELLGVEVEASWFATPNLEHGAVEKLAATDAVWCAPGSPFASLEGALEGIRFAREHQRPFLGTCAGFQHGVLEIARNVAGISDARHGEYGEATGAGPLFIDELLCSLSGQTMGVDLVDADTRAVYGADHAREEYYCRFGLQESYRPQLSEAGLVVAGVDRSDGGTRIMRLAPHPFFYLTLFVPQTSSAPERPHPLVTAYLAAAART